MKNLKVIIVFVFSSLVLWSCVAQKSANSSQKNLNREWMLVSFKDYPKEKLVSYQAKMNLVPNAESPDQFSAKMGCNNLFFTAKFLTNNRIEFSQVGSTMMYCEGKMDLESAFGKALPTMNSYKLEGHYLTLSGGNGNEMKFLAADWD